jgi:hypothetical protein
MNGIEIEKYLDAFGKVGTRERLQAIAWLNLGARSEAAKQVLRNRERRIELMKWGLTFSEACLIVNIEQKS